MFHEEEDRIQYLEHILLDYLAIHARGDSALFHTRHFYIAQWYHDAEPEIRRMKAPKKSPPKPPKRMKQKLGGKRKKGK